MSDPSVILRIKALPCFDLESGWFLVQIQKLVRDHQDDSLSGYTLLAPVLACMCPSFCLPLTVPQELTSG